MSSEPTKDQFSNLTSETILSAVEACGHRCSGRILQLNSMENRVFSVELEGADAGEKPRSVVAKFYRPGRWTADAICSEHLLQQVLSEESIPTPRLHSVQDSSFLAKLQKNPAERLHPSLLERFDPRHTVGKSGEYFFCVWDKIAGRAPLELGPNCLQKVGRIVARMHNLFENAFVQGGFERKSMSVDYFCARTLVNLEKSKHVPFYVKRALLPLLEELAQGLLWLEKSIDFVPIHGDLHRLNLLQTQNGGDFWVVDFDDCLWGPEIHDLWLLAAGVDLLGVEGVKESTSPLDYMLEGYREFRRMPQGSEILVEPLRTLRMIYYPGWIAERWEGDRLFRDVFTFFQEENYWERFLNDMEEQKEILQNEGLLEL
jgi:Ser/Thr protein kinase RdoA (MazF antagonist)